MALGRRGVADGQIARSQFAHSLTRIGDRLPSEVDNAVFTFVLDLVAAQGLQNDKSDDVKRAVLNNRRRSQRDKGRQLQRDKG